MRFSQVLLGQFAQSLLAVNGHENGSHEGNERLVGADVGGGFLAADVLFASSQGEAEGPIAARVLGLTDNAARYLAHELFLGGDDSRERTAVNRRNRKRLQLPGDDVGIARRLHQAE